MTSPSPTKIVLAVLVADRPGIMRAITAAITDLGGNIDGVSQTVVEGYFSIVLTASFRDPMPLEHARAAVAAPFGDGDACVVVRPFAPVTREHALAHGRRYVLVVTGDDRPGILKTTTGALTAHGINIEDWTYHVEGPRVTYIGVLTVPDGVQVADVQRALHRALDAMGLQCRIQHENIFRATNEVGPIKALMREADNAARP